MARESEGGLRLFMRADVERLDAHRRTEMPGIVNLKSCELLHPKAARYVEQALCGFAAVDAVRYPLHQEAIARVAHLLGVERDMVLLSAGSDALIAATTRAFAATVGRAVLQVPCYESWHHYLALDRVLTKPAAMSLTAGVQPDLRALADGLADHPSSIVVITNPHSPTGVRFDTAEVAALAESASRHDHLLVIDECYAWFDGISHAHLAVEYDNVLLIRSFSKGFGLAGARVACAIGNAELIDYLARWRIDGPVSAMSLHLLVEFADRPQELTGMWDDIGQWREEFVTAVLSQRPDWVAFASVANFATFRTTGPAEAEAVAHALLDAGFRVRHLIDVAGLEDCLRVTVAEPVVMHQVATVIGSL